jgi:hypothetical protein
LLLKFFLKRMATTGEKDRPAGFIPEECLQEYFHQPNITTPFLELILYRKRNDRFEYLYQKRRDRWWNGFCAFGGMIRSNQTSSPVEIAQQLIDREFRGVGLKVASLQVVSFLRWPKHPWCNPLAVTCLIQVAGEIPSAEERVWLSVDSLPENLVVNHDTYLRQCEYFLRTGRALVFTPTKPDGLSVSQ